MAVRKYQLKNVISCETVFHLLSEVLQCSFLLPVTQAAASRAREQVLAQVSMVREALEEEEQRLLEQVHQEEERVEQCLLTQRAHWTQALASLSQTRLRLVHTLTHTPDAQLVVRDGEGDGGVDGKKLVFNAHNDCLFPVSSFRQTSRSSQRGKHVIPS